MVLRERASRIGRLNPRDGTFAEFATPTAQSSPVGIAAGVLSLSVLQEILAILGSPDYVSSLITGGLLVVVTIVWAPELGQWFRVTRVATAVEERA